MNLLRALGWLVLPALSLSLPAPSGAATAILELDSYSFFFFEGAGSGGAIPSARIPVEISPQGLDSWRIEIAPGSLTLPEVVYPSGKRVAWRLSAPATGSIDRNAGTYRCQLSAPALAFVDGNAKGIPMTFQFTTETTSAVAAGVTASRDGARLDPGSGYLQLVAAGVNPIDAASAPGKPFYIVLSGRLTGVSF